MSVKLFSSKGSEEIRTMYNLSNNTEFVICDETDEIIEEPFESLLQRYQEKLEK